MKQRIFHYAILWHPTEKEAKDGAKTKLIVEPKMALAKDEQTAVMAATMEIPAEYKTQLDQIEIAVRAF